MLFGVGVADNLSAWKHAAESAFFINVPLVWGLLIDLLKFWRSVGSRAWVPPRRADKALCHDKNNHVHHDVHACEVVLHFDTVWQLAIGAAGRILTCIGQQFDRAHMNVLARQLHYLSATTP